MVEAATSGMSPFRRRIVSAFILGLLGLIALSNLIRREAWPICNYPMYAALNSRGDGNRLEFYVVRGNREVRLIQTYRVMANLSLDYTLPYILQKEGWQSDNAKAALALVLDDLVEGWKSGGDPADEPTAVKVYQVDFHLPETGDPAFQVTDKRLVLEVDRPAP